MNRVSIQPININDVEILRATAIKAYCDHYLDFWYDEGHSYLENSFSIGRLTKELSDPDSRFYLLNYDGLPAGFLKLNINTSFDLDPAKNAMEIERIYLNKNATGKNIGKQAILFSIDLAKSLGKHLIWLKVMDTSSGPIQFYEKMGFEKCGTYRLDFPQMREELRGMFIMKIILTASR
ncbi:MAG: family N-acetyltransferase [Chitinophagaceae bacterium]|nr:family N-acetyltransferase [Chitinophagaceae bacterium]